MVDITFSEQFKKTFKKIKDPLLKQKIITQIKKLKDQPNRGKPMKYARKGTRELYISPFRLSYAYENNTIYLLALYHKDNQ